MPTRERLRRHGDGLFRRRSYVPVALLPLLAAGARSPSPAPAVTAAATTR
jgi:hypothetical protein